MYATTRIDKIADLLEKCWSAITQITMDWPNWAEFQYLRESDWKHSEPIYNASNLSANARDLYELTRRNELKQEINRSMFGFINEQQKVFYYAYLREFLKEVNRISERLDEYFDKVDDSTGIVHSEAIKWDVSLIRDAIFDVNYTIVPFLPAYQSQSSVNTDTPQQQEQLTYTNDSTKFSSVHAVDVLLNPENTQPELDIDMQQDNSASIKITQGGLSLFYYYCHETGCLPTFQSGKLEQEYRAVTEPHDLSWKRFQIFYNKFSNRGERLSSGAREALQNAIQMLQKHPKALALAETELNIAEARNPIT